MMLMESHLTRAPTPNLKAISSRPLEDLNVGDEDSIGKFLMLDVISKDTTIEPSAMKSNRPNTSRLSYKCKLLIEIFLKKYDNFHVPICFFLVRYYISHFLSNFSLILIDNLKKKSLFFKSLDLF